VTAAVGRPAYQQVAADLREKIAAGEIPVGAAIPSTARLAGEHGVSITVVRAAVNQLRADGLVTGQPGKGVFVCATPASVAERALGIGELSELIEELRVVGQAEAVRRAELEAEVARLREQVSVVESRLGTIYKAMGRSYPPGEGGGERA